MDEFSSAYAKGVNATSHVENLSDQIWSRTPENCSFFVFSSRRNNFKIMTFYIHKVTVSFLDEYLL